MKISKPVPAKTSRAALNDRRQEIELCLAEFGLARGPRRLRSSSTVSSERSRIFRLRTCLEKLGPVFSAFGLYLSTRVDLLPAEERLELRSIRDLAAAAPMSAFNSVIKQELNCTPQDLFTRIEETSTQSHLISQSHRARLADGREVVVTFIRTEVEACLPCDTALLPLLKVGFDEEVLSDAAFESAIEDFNHVLRQQIDCVEQAQAFRAVVQDEEEFGMLRVPVVHEALCTSRLLTIEHLPGLTLRDVFRLLDPENEDSETVSPARERFDQKDLARRLCAVWLRQAFLGRYFPVEPSIDNITVLPNRQLGFTGGLLVSLPPGPKTSLWDYLIATATDNPNRAYSCFFKELLKEKPLSEDDDLPERFRQIVPLREGISMTERDGNSLGAYLFAHWRLASERGYLPPSHLSSFYRGLFHIDAIACRLAPEGDALSEGLHDVRLLTGVEKFRDMIDLRHLGDHLEEYGAVLMQLPERIDEVLTLAAEGKARMRIQLPNSVGPRGRKRSSAIVIALLLGLAAFALLSHRFAALLPGVSVDSFSAVVFVVLGGLLLWAASRA